MGVFSAWFNRDTVAGSVISLARRRLPINTAAPSGGLWTRSPPVAASVARVPLPEGLGFFPIMLAAVKKLSS